LVKKINSILISNRGEIALRVIRACKEIGIKSIAVYSDEDVRSIHVKKADEAYHIGPAAASESYLAMDKIIDTANRVGAEAIHPGYGFLSENESFAEACEKKGIIFIGPNSEALEITGDKMKCKAVMKKAKVPSVPGSDGIIDDVEEAADVAHTIGYPVLLKSAFGGGGRGIRLANNEKELRKEFEMVSTESKAAFGKSALFIEKYLDRIRHIEMSPSPVVDQKTRNNVGEIAKRAADAVEYLNAGTAEFLRDHEGNFYFIEINSRLQVEHPVTELVTGVDLVKMQIAIAQDEEIPFKQDELKMHGCAIECRINAEDPFYEFSPSVGAVPDCSIPYGPGIRVDTYLYPGCTVSGYYDSLVAKLIAWGSDFEEARKRTRNGLYEFTIEGINTTIPLYKTIVDEENFIKGELSTDYIDRFNLMDKMHELTKKQASMKSSAAIAAILLQLEFAKTGGPSFQFHKAKPYSNWKRSQVNR